MTQITCKGCGGTDLRPDIVTTNPTGRSQDYRQSIEAVCLTCGFVEDVTDQVRAAEASGETVRIGSHDQVRRIP